MAEGILFKVTTPADKKAAAIFSKVVEAITSKRHWPQSDDLFLLRHGDGLYFIHVLDSQYSQDPDYSEMRYTLPGFATLTKTHGRTMTMLDLCQNCLTTNTKGYTVDNFLWNIAAKDPKGILCLDCLSSRLGEPLTPDMFDMNIPINITAFYGSESEYFGESK